MAKREVTVTVITGESKTGLWCEDCALPSLVEIPLLMMSRYGVSHLKTVTYCTEQPDLHSVTGYPDSPGRDPRSGHDR